jgi:hypothetical protein
MTKHIACNDVVPGCAFEASAGNEDELRRQVTTHAAKAVAGDEPAFETSRSRCSPFCAAVADRGEGSAQSVRRRRARSRPRL